MPAGAVVVVLPGRDAVADLRRLAPALPRDWVRAVVLVDADGRAPRTAGVRALAPPPDGHREAACLQAALELGADAVALLRPDGDPDPLIVPRLAGPILDGRADVVLASRALAPGGRGGAPARVLAERLAAAVPSAVLGTRLTEPWTPWRAVGRDALERLPWRSGPAGRPFDADLALLALGLGLRVREVAARTGGPAPPLGPELALAARTTAGALALAAHRRHWWRWRRLRR